ncbi:MAG: aminopeptidase [Culicoidibacterales bacterium]
MISEKQLQYIQLIIKKGLGIKQGDRLHIMADVKSAEFTQKVVESAYCAGAIEVEVYYTDEVISRLKGINDEDALFDVYPESEHVKLETWLAKESKRLTLTSPNPAGMAGVESSRIMRFQKAAEQPMSNYRKALMGNNISWTIAAIPNEIWAKTVFPNAATEKEAMKLLWEAIFASVHLNDGPDACLNWEKHITILQKKVEQLNKANIKSLHYKNSLGTDLVVNLPEGHLWEGGGAKNNKTGDWFAPNMPTEEVFTLGDANHVNGIVYSSKPLLFSGQLIDNFWLEFKDGAVIKAQAQTGDKMLQELLKADDGARRIGEVALVPFDSPISQSGNLFSMTLFDENASCHLALGNAYSGTLPKSIGKTKAELAEMGFNTSLIHVDFMIGTADLTISATTINGDKIDIFTKGNFAL